MVATFLKTPILEFDFLPFKGFYAELPVFHFARHGRAKRFFGPKKLFDFCNKVFVGNCVLLPNIGENKSGYQYHTKFLI